MFPSSDRKTEHRMAAEPRRLRSGADEAASSADNDVFEKSMIALCHSMYRPGNQSMDELNSLIETIPSLPLKWISLEKERDAFFAAVRFFQHAAASVKTRFLSEAFQCPAIQFYLEQLLSDLEPAIEPLTDNEREQNRMILEYVFSSIFASGSDGDDDSSAAVADSSSAIPSLAASASASVSASVSASASASVSASASAPVSGRDEPRHVSMGDGQTASSPMSVSAAISVPASDAISSTRALDVESPRIGANDRSNDGAHSTHDAPAGSAALEKVPAHAFVLSTIIAAATAAPIATAAASEVGTPRAGTSVSARSFSATANVSLASSSTKSSSSSDSPFSDPSLFQTPSLPFSSSSSSSTSSSFSSSSSSTKTSTISPTSSVFASGSAVIDPSLSPELSPVIKFGGDINDSVAKAAQAASSLVGIGDGSGTPVECQQKYKLLARQLDFSKETVFQLQASEQRISAANADLSVALTTSELALVDLGAEKTSWQERTDLMFRTMNYQMSSLRHDFVTQGQTLGAQGQKIVAQEQEIVALGQTSFSQGQTIVTQGQKIVAQEQKIVTQELEIVALGQTSCCQEQEIVALRADSDRQIGQIGELTAQCTASNVRTAALTADLSGVTSKWTSSQRAISRLSNESAAFRKRVDAMQYLRSLTTVRQVSEYLIENSPALKWAAKTGQQHSSPAASSSVAFVAAVSSPAASPCASAAAASSATGIVLMRRQVGKIFDSHGVASLPSWFRKYSEDTEFLDRTAATFEVVRIDRNDMIHPKRLLVSRAEMVSIIDAHPRGSDHEDLGAACSVLLEILDEFFAPECWSD